MLLASTLGFGDESICCFLSAEGVSPRWQLCLANGMFSRANGQG